jgi:hypothetical protein
MIRARTHMRQHMGTQVLYQFGLGALGFFVDVHVFGLVVVE